MRTVLITTFFLYLAGLSFAQESAAPPLRLSPEKLAGAAQRIDAAASTYERIVWERTMRVTPVAERTPLVVPEAVDDATFVRRVSLDLEGRLPSAQRIRDFLADTDPAKRANLVDCLLQESASAARRFTRLADMLRVKDEVLGVSLRPFISWLQDASARAMPYDEMVRDMITASGDVNTNPATGWLLRDGGRVTVTATEALRVFLDEDISCARCHDHPYNPWTQMQFYQLASCFGGMRVVKTGGPDQKVLWPPDSWNDAVIPPVAPNEQLALLDVRGNPSLPLPAEYKYKDGSSGLAVRPSLRGWRGADLTTDNILSRVKGENLRAAVADWMVDSQRFSLVAALRTWHELFGVPTQGGSSIAMRESREPNMASQLGVQSCNCEYAFGCSLPMWGSGEPLVDFFLERRNDQGQRRLGETLLLEFRRVNHDLREFERILCNTVVYQRQSITMTMGQGPQFRAPVMRRLRPETIWNNLVLVQTDGAPAPGLLSHEQSQVPAQNDPSRILGRTLRDRADDSASFITHDLVRFMMNGEATRLGSDAESALVRRLRKTQPAETAIDEAFLAVLGRFPSPQEKSKATEYGKANPSTVWSDLVWSLLNTGEFLFQR